MSGPAGDDSDVPLRQRHGLQQGRNPPDFTAPLLGIRLEILGFFRIFLFSRGWCELFYFVFCFLSESTAQVEVQFLFAQFVRSGYGAVVFTVAVTVISAFH